MPQVQSYLTTPDPSNQSGHHYQEYDGTERDAGENAGKELIVAIHKFRHVHFRYADVQVVFKSGHILWRVRGWSSGSTRSSRKELIAR